jgi:hypothetical protein
MLEIPRLRFVEVQYAIITAWLDLVEANARVHLFAVPPGRAYHGYKGPLKPGQSSEKEPSATTPTEPSESNSNPSASA